MTRSEKEYLVRALRILLQINDIKVMKYTIESLLDKLEDSNDEQTEEPKK